jgi:hypothetical protein
MADRYTTAKHLPKNDFAALFKEMHGSCVKRGGSYWTNLTEKATLTFDLIEFLDANFRR